MRITTLLVVLALSAGPQTALSQVFQDASERLLTEPDGSLVIWGASMADVNQDGLQDLYHRSRLLLQDGDGRFSDVMASSRFPEGDGSEVFGAVFGDGDGDGFPDLYVEDFDPGSRYFRNRFGLRWDVANQESGIDMSSFQSQGAVWGDFDGDGDLDLFVGEEFGNNRYFENLGGGTFRDSRQSGILNDRHSYGAAAADYDLDGDLDVFIAACFSGSPSKSVNSLFRNDGNGLFTDVAAEAGVDDDFAGWAVAWLDYDRDGLPDVFVANMPIGGADSRPGFNKLYRNRGDGTFEDVSEAAGVAGDEQDFGFGGAVADFDNDGWEDIYLANGFGPHQLFRNQGDGTFRDIFPATGIAPTSESIAVSVGDIDRDGRVDVLTAGRTGNRLYLNQGGGGGFVTVQLRASGANPFAVGARVEGWTGGRPLQRFVTAGDGMTSQNHGFLVHLGLGNATGLDSLNVFWPGGGITRLGPVQANAHLNLVEGLGENAPPSPPILMGPAEGATIAAGGEVTFDWGDVEDIDGDALSYTLAILSLDDRSPKGEWVRSGLTASSLTVDLSGMADGTYAWTVVVSDGNWKRGATGGREFVLGMPVAIANAPDLPGFHLYPNPVQGSEAVLQVPPAMEGTWLELVDVLGRVHSRVRLASGRQVIDMHHVAPGLYFVRTPKGVLSVMKAR